MKSGQLNTRITSFTIMDEFWTFTRVKIPLKSMGRFPWVRKLVQLHKFCLYWVALIQKRSHAGKQINSSLILYILLNIFNNRLYVEGFVSDVKICSEENLWCRFSAARWALRRPMYMLNRDDTKGNALPVAERRGFGGCHVPPSSPRTARVSWATGWEMTSEDILNTFL